MLVKFGFAQMEVVQIRDWSGGDCRPGRGVGKTTENNGTKQSAMRKGGVLQFKKNYLSNSDPQKSSAA